jgi:hypothetical protein
MGFRAWCQALGDMGLKVDGHAFDLTNRPALHAIYDLIPASPADAYGRIVALQKGAQMGLTVWEVLADLYMAVKWRPITIGLYLPDQPCNPWFASRAGRGTSSPGPCWTQFSCSCGPRDTP